MGGLETVPGSAAGHQMGGEEAPGRRCVTGSRRVRVRTMDQLLGSVFGFQAAQASSATSGFSEELL